MAMQRASVGTVLAVSLVGLVGIALVAGLLTASRTLPNSGNLRTVGVSVYWDSGCTNVTQSVSWGIMEPNTTKSIVLYIKNNGTVGMVLSMTSSNWNPSSASNYITLNWNCTSYVLSHEGVVVALLTLSVSPDISGITSFGFDITITGTEST